MFMLLCGTLHQRICFVLLLCYFCKRIWLRWFMEFFLKRMYVCAGLYGIFCQRICSRCLCVPTIGVIYVSCETWVYEILFLFFVFLVYGLIRLMWHALSVKIEALEKQVSADSVDRALVCVRQLAGRPAGRALRWD